MKSIFFCLKNFFIELLYRKYVKQRLSLIPFPYKATCIGFWVTKVYSYRFVLNYFYKGLNKNIEDSFIQTINKCLEEINKKPKKYYAKKRMDSLVIII